MVVLLLAASTGTAWAQAPGLGPANEPAGPDESGDDSTPAIGAYLTRQLIADGFSDVAVVVDGSRVVVRFENTRYRDKHRALDAAAVQISGALAPGQRLVLVATEAGVPLVQAVYRARDDRGGRAPAESEAPRITVALDALPPTLFGADDANPRSGKMDLVVHPWLQASFGNTDILAARVGVAPEMRMVLRRGLTASAQMLLTLHDDIPTGESRVRPGLITLNQRARLPRNVLLSATVGAFVPDRYGADLELRAFSADGRWSAGLETALTGAVVYGDDDWYYTPVRQPTALADISWRDFRRSVVVRATAGAFLGDERGARLDVVRQFGATDVGFFAAAGPEGKNVGVNVRLALPSARHPRPGAFRIRSADAFRFEYHYEDSGLGGRRFRSGEGLDEVGRWLVRER